MQSPDASSRLDLLYREHGQIVVAICGSLLRERHEAEDAAQQVFLSAYRAILNGTVPRDPGAWLAVIARNECRARWQVPRHEPVAEEQLDERSTDPPADVIRRAEIAALWEAISELPPMQREALLLREIRGLSYDQLSDNLALSRSSVRSLLSRARRRVRVRLQDGFAAAGGASWLEPVLRLFGGGSGTAVSAATKVVAVGLGAAALAGGATVGPERNVRATHQPPRFAAPAAAAVRPHATAGKALTPIAVRLSRPLPARTSSSPRRGPERDRVPRALPAASEPEHSDTIEVADSSGRGTDGGGGTVTAISGSSGSSTVPTTTPATTSGGGSGSGSSSGTSDGSLTSTSRGGSGDLLVTTTTSSGGTGSGGSPGDSSSTSGSDLTSGSGTSDGD